MQNLFDIDAWRIIEHGFDPSKQQAAESIFSIGNGAFGQRANFEEHYGGASLQGSYVGGVYYPDKTRVGWWKNGYPEYFAKVLNSCNWIGIGIEVESQVLDLSKSDVKSFYRELNMQTGVLTRHFTCKLQDGKEVEVKSVRFCSMDNDELAAISYSIKPLNFSGNIKFTPYLDFDVRNQDANYGDMFWEETSRNVGVKKGFVCAKTKKTNFQVAVAMNYTFSADGEDQQISPNEVDRELYVENNFKSHVVQGRTYTINKYISLISSIHHSDLSLEERAVNRANKAKEHGFDQLIEKHKEAWGNIWRNADIQIKGDVSAQQAIRFNIFHLYQTYTGKNVKLNIGPKGFTGEKYGGATYWDTEAYCLPFFLKTAPQRVAKQLLKYRYHHLSRAIENAEKLGFNKGAALYPMVTMNGEECHNEWEITFEEIHRNGAIAYAIYNYVRHTGDKQYLIDYGREVLVAIARFWAQRVNWSEDKQQFVILGVTGPNEYENNVNNNWYTNYIARWCIKYALEVDGQCSSSVLRKYEADTWINIIENMYLPQIKDTKIFLQNDGFLDKEQVMADELPESDRPINQHWSWDRILRSVFIKQADVLQGLYFFEEDFDLETIKENFNYYEPRTVHESSLSPCVHNVLASKIGANEKAYEMYLRTARLDLDDYNKEVDEGLHITSMAGSWMSVVEGFAGVRVNEKGLFVNPILPDGWNEYAFNMLYRENPLRICVKPNSIELINKSDHSIKVHVFGEEILIESNQTISKAC